MKKKALIVDDEPSLRELYAEMLNVFGFDCIECSCAFDAWQKIEEEADGIGIVLSDIEMSRPGEGFELLGLIRQSPRPAISNLPVILASGNWNLLENDPRSRLADKCLKKPFALREIIDFIKAKEKEPV